MLHVWRNNDWIRVERSARPSVAPAISKSWGNEQRWEQHMTELDGHRKPYRPEGIGSGMKDLVERAKAGQDISVADDGGPDFSETMSEAVAA